MQNIHKDTQIINEYHCHIFSPGWPSVCGIALASLKSSKWTPTLYCRDLVCWPTWVTSFKSQSMGDGHWAGRATASTPKFFCEKIASFCTLTFTTNVSWQRQQIVTLLVDMFCSIRFIYWSTILCIEGMSVICVFITFLSVFKIISWTSYNFSFLPFRGVVSTTTEKARIPLVNRHVLLERISGLVNFSTVVTGIVYIFEVLGLNLV